MKAFQEYPKWVAGRLAQDAEDEALFLAEAEAETPDPADEDFLSTEPSKPRRGRPPKNPLEK